jgi:hypothetical protein
VPKKKKTRYYHYAIICPYPEIGQVGCGWASSLKEMIGQLEDKCDTAKRMLVRDCPVCKESNR